MSLAAGLEEPGHDAGSVELRIESELRGRMVLAEPGGPLWLGRNYDILRSDDGGDSWQRVTTMPRDWIRRVAGPSRLLSRLVRHEVRALCRTRSGNLVGSNRQGLFVATPGQRLMRPAVVEAAEGYMPPMRLSLGPQGEVLWGEYGSPKRPTPIRLYVSRDEGESFQRLHTLDGILHVHNIVWDPGEGHYWVLTGDFDPQPGIGRLSGDLARFEWFVKGEQRFRAVEIFDLGDRLVYATDSHLERNALVSLDKRSGRTERIREFGGSCIYACRFGGLYALTTSVEPSTVNHSLDSELWLSRDAERWHLAWRGRKDRWSPYYLQFGSLVLPSGASDDERILFSGQAIRGLDGRTAVARLAPGGPL